MAKQSAGLLMYRMTRGEPEVLLVHPGGPFWAKKDLNSWDIPKGEVKEGEDLFAAAKREFEEETQIKPVGEFVELQSVKMSSGKEVFIWAFEGNCDVTKIVSNTLEVEWPPKSGRLMTIPEIDRGEFFTISQAYQKIHKYLAPILEQFKQKIKNG